MPSTTRRIGAPEWLILIGSAGFIAMLTISAVFEADIRWLHFFQAWMYVATSVLSLKKSRWGHFLGIAVAGFWNYSTVFVNTFFRNGLHELAAWVQTGRMARPDQFISVPAWLSNLLIIVGCVWAYKRIERKSAGDLGRFAGAVAASMAFFAADMALFQPRYLALFRGLLHPHLR